MNTYRQGDLLITQVDSIPKGLKERKSLVLVYGEATGHAHRLTNGKVFEGKDNLLYLMLNKGADLVHEEHKTISLKKGKYMVIRQKEYTNKDAVKIVKD